MKLNGDRGAALLVGGAFAIFRGLAYLPAGGPPNTLPLGLELFAQFLTIEVWAGAWLLIGLGCIVRAFGRDDVLAWSLLIGISVAWGTAYLFGWINSLFAGQPSREWLNATTYILPWLTIAFLLRKARPRAVPDGDAP